MFGVSDGNDPLTEMDEPPPNLSILVFVYLIWRTDLK